MIVVYYVVMSSLSMIDVSLSVLLFFILSSINHFCVCERSKSVESRLASSIESRVSTNAQDDNDEQYIYYFKHGRIVTTTTTATATSSRK